MKWPAACACTMFLGLIFHGAALSESNSEFRIVSTISGKTYEAIAVGVNELHEIGASPTDYEIAVATFGNTTFVMFQNKGRTPSIRGSVGPLVEFEVQLDTETLRVIKAHFVR